MKRQNVNFEESFEETGPATPVFFILSPGVNPLKVCSCAFFDALILVY